MIVKEALAILAKCRPDEVLEVCAPDGEAMGLVEGIVPSGEGHPQSCLLLCTERTFRCWRCEPSTHKPTPATFAECRDQNYKQLALSLLHGADDEHPGCTDEAWYRNLLDDSYNEGNYRDLVEGAKEELGKLIVSGLLYRKVMKQINKLTDRSYDDIR